MRFLGVASRPALVLSRRALATFVIARSIEARYPPAGRFVEVAGGRLHLVEWPAGRRTGDGPAAPRRLRLLRRPARLRSASASRALSRDRARPSGQRLERPVGGEDAASPAGRRAIIREALDTLGVERAIVVGHSWSGALATNLALDHADAVAGLVLLSPVEPSLARRRHLLVLRPDHRGRCSGGL